VIRLSDRTFAVRALPSYWLNSKLLFLLKSPENIYTVMQFYDMIAFFICLAALFAYLNHKVLRLTPTVGIMVLSLVVSVAVIIAASIFPALSSSFVALIGSINFPDLLLNGMLSFLLFAGSYQIDSAGLRSERAPVLLLATAGIFISTFLVGTLLYFAISIFSASIPYIYCLLFAALISPTDPVAVLAILKRAGIRKSLELKISGESLFNDGVAVVVFLTLLKVAQKGPGNLSLPDVYLLFCREAGGGLLAGYALGFAGARITRSVDRTEIATMVTIGIVMGGYAIAGRLGVSGPLAMVVSGIVMGTDMRTRFASHSRQFLSHFWELIEDMLNTILFMLIGFEMLVVKMSMNTVIIGFITILILMLARWLSVLLPVAILRLRINFEKNVVAILTWGGIRGGLSVALALSLPTDCHRDLFVPVTYIVVVFSVIVQGLTIGRLYRKLSA
jgi:monovalent cation:H+ antiporter, CPA1 family